MHVLCFSLYTAEDEWRTLPIDLWGPVEKRIAAFAKKSNAQPNLPEMTSFVFNVKTGRELRAAMVASKTRTLPGGYLALIRRRGGRPLQAWLVVGLKCSSMQMRLTESENMEEGWMKVRCFKLDRANASQAPPETTFAELRDFLQDYPDSEPEEEDLDEGVDAQPELVPPTGILPQGVDVGDAAAEEVASASGSSDDEQLPDENEAVHLGVGGAQRFQ